MENGNRALRTLRIVFGTGRSMYQRCAVHTLLLQRWEQIGEEMLHPTGKWRIKLADMQNAHAHGLHSVQRRNIFSQAQQAQVQ